MRKIKIQKIVGCPPLETINVRDTTTPPVDVYILHNADRPLLITTAPEASNDNDIASKVKN